MAKQTEPHGMNPERATSSDGASTFGATIENDETYGLVSVLYHSLQGAQSYSRYIEDARRSGNAELAGFFEECRDQLNEQAYRARSILADQLEDDDFDEEDEGEDE